MELPTVLSLLLLTLFLSLSSTTSLSSDDTAALSLFRSHTDAHAILLSNWTLTSSTSTACTASWRGVNCTNNRVTALKLPSLNLRGSISSLSSLDQLRFLDLSNNRLNGSISAITKCTNLKHIYLSNNDLSSEIPREISSLRRLVRLDLSDNNIRGSIPTEFSSLTRLLTLHLHNNELPCLIPRSLELEDLLKASAEMLGKGSLGTVYKAVLLKHTFFPYSSPYQSRRNPNPTFPNFPIPHTFFPLTLNFLLFNFTFSSSSPLDLPLVATPSNPELFFFILHSSATFSKSFPNFLTAPCFTFSPSPSLSSSSTKNLLFRFNIYGVGGGGGNKSASISSISDSFAFFFTDLSCSALIFLMLP